MVHPHQHRPDDRSARMAQHFENLATQREIDEHAAARLSMKMLVIAMFGTLALICAVLWFASSALALTRDLPAVVDRAVAERGM